MASYTVGGKNFTYAPASKTVEKTGSTPKPGYTQITQSTIGGGQTTTTNTGGNLTITTKPGTWTGGAYPSGGNSGTLTYKYAVTPLEAVKRSAISGDAINYPSFPNTPKGIVDQGNYVAEVARIKSQLNNESAQSVVNRKVTQNVEKVKSTVESYNARGENLQAEAGRLSSMARGLNTSSASDVMAFNAMVKDFNARSKAYAKEGLNVSSQVANVNTQVQKAENIAKVYSPGETSRLPGLIGNTQTFDTKINQTDSKTSSPVIVNQKPKAVTNKDVLTSYDSKPKGVKLKVETAESLLKKGAFGTVIEQEAKGTDFFKDPLKKIGLEIGSVPAMFGQRFGQNVALVSTGGKKEAVFDLDKKFIYENQVGKQRIAETYSLNKAVKAYKTDFELRPIETSVGIALDSLILVPGAGSLALTKLAGKSKIVSGGLKGLDKAVSKIDSFLGRTIYTGKALALGEPSIKVAIKSTKGVTLGTVRTDIVSRLVGRKTIKLSDITSADIAKAFTEKGKSQYLKFSGSEKELFTKAISGKEAKFIKNTFKELGLKSTDVIGFSSESGKATGFIEAFTKKGKIQYRYVGSEPYGKFFASRTATGPLSNLNGSSNLRVTYSNAKIAKPSVTVGVGEQGILSTKGGIKGSIKQLGFDVSKTNKQIQTYFNNAIKSSARPPKLKELRKLFGEKEVAKGYVIGDLSSKGKFLSSPSRVYGISVEEELIVPFSSRSKLLGNLKERLFSPAVVDVGGKRIKLNIKRYLPELNVKTKSANLLLKANKSTSSVSGVSRVVDNFRYVNVTPIVGGISSLSKAVSSVTVPKVSSGKISSLSDSVPTKVSTEISSPKVSSGISSVSIPSISSSISGISVSKVSSGTPKVSTSISSVSTSVSTAKTSQSVPSLSVSIPKVSTSISSVSTSISTPRISQSVSIISTNTPKISTSISSISTPIKGISTRITPYPTRITTPITRITTGITSVPTRVTTGTSRISTSISKGSRLTNQKNNFNYKKPKTPSLSFNTPKSKVSSPRINLTQRTFTQPKYKEEKLVQTRGYQSQGRYYEASKFRDIKSLKNRTNLMGFKTRNDFIVSNVFKDSNLFKKKANLSKSSFTNLYKSKNNYNYSNNYSVSIKYKNYKPYKYSTKLVDTDKFNTKISLKA